LAFSFGPPESIIMMMLVVGLCLSGCSNSYGAAETNRLLGSICFTVVPTYYFDKIYCGFPFARYEYNKTI
jgi:hypothetical protein